MQSLTETRTYGSKSAVDHLAFRSTDDYSTPKAHTIDLIGTDVAFARNAQIYGEGEPSIYLYRITSGLARCYRMTPDGRRQIVAFYVAGDLFGFEVSDHHTLSVEVMTESRICIIRRSLVMSAMSRDSDMARDIWLNANREIERGQEHILQFGRPAPARVASFLLEMERRVSTANNNALAISRQDIADYLDLRIETVSRAMTRLARAGAIAPSCRRKIAIRDSRALRQMVD
jgi:CRP/FNR family transcriptional regulator, nitrogen fixation regulation protein